MLPGQQEFLMNNPRIQLNAHSYIEYMHVNLNV